MRSVWARVLRAGAGAGPRLAGLALRSVFTKHISRSFSITGCTLELIQPTLALENASIPIKKRVVRKRTIEDVPQQEGHFLTLAFATANSYDLKGIRDALLQQNLYEPGRLATQETPDVVHASAKYKVGSEPREIFFFSEGATVFWNCTETEASNVLGFLQAYERDKYPEDFVQREREVMTYNYNAGIKKCQMQESNFVLVTDTDNVLEKYTFSNAMAQSVKLGVWESQLETLAESIQTVSGDMERGKTLTLSKEDVVRKLGELFSLRYRINVESDLLDTPDFYWEQEELEKLYAQTIAYFTIPRRTRVLNERLAHCVELVELLSTWVQDKHHVRLEWMIIVLIMVEVCFELLHFVERAFEIPNPLQRPITIQTFVPVEAPSFPQIMKNNVI